MAAQNALLRRALTGTAHEVGVRLSYVLLKEAEKRGAQVINYHLPAMPVESRVLPARNEPAVSRPDPASGGFLHAVDRNGLSVLPIMTLGLQRMFLRPIAASREAEHVHADARVGFYICHCAQYRR